MRLLSGMLLAVWALASAASPVEVTGLRAWQESDTHTRVVLDLSGAVEHAVFSLHDPERVVVDLRHARLGDTLQMPARSDDGRLQRIRAAPRHGRDLRVVLDLRGRVKPRSFLLPPDGRYPQRLVIDLDEAQAASAPALTVKRAVAHRHTRDVIIAIDPGHGGKDPGARGPNGTREKDVVLAIGRELARLIRLEPGMRPVMTRNRDAYISLRGRIRKARQHKADLFVSVHADAFKDPRARGSSVYVVSERGATSEAARWLAAKENASDLVGGVSLADKNKLLASVLLDLSQTATIEASLNVGGRVLSALKSVGPVHKPWVEQAGFVVLKSPDIPSILVETAFISNPTEERKLQRSSERRQLARAIMQGIRAYFASHPPPGTVLASRRHVISTGETLAGIASRYQVSVDVLRRTNGISGDTVRTGQVLVIPGAGDS